MTNEPAERLLHLEGFLTDAGLDFEDIPKALAIANRALAAERRATVERLKAQLLAGAFIPSGGIHDEYLKGIFAARNHYLELLDAEAAAAREAL